MKKTSVIILLICISISSYAQSKHIKEFAIKAESVLILPANKEYISTYVAFKRDAESKRYSYYGGRNEKKNNLILDNIDKRVSDSIAIYYKRKEEFLEKQRRINQIANSLERDSIEQARIAKQIESARRDSIRRATQQDFFSVEAIVKNIGKETYSKEKIEKTLYIYPSAYQGTWTFYELDDMFISVKYFGLEDICIELGFRLFGEDASFYKKELMNAGFKYQKSFRDTMIENHSQGYSNLQDTEIQRYRKYTGTEYVICDIYYDRFTTFKFYRGRYKK